MAAAPPIAALGSRNARPVSPEDRGMLRTVLWHRDEAVAGHVEIHYDPSPGPITRLRFKSPRTCCSVRCWRWWPGGLYRLRRKIPGLNSTIAGDRRYVYDQVNLGFTVQNRTTLYLAVVEGAEKLSAREFIDRLSELQRKAMKDSLKPQESSGSTIAFTSMARWKVSRHAPILPPHNSLIVAHTAAILALGGISGSHLRSPCNERRRCGPHLQKVSTPPEL